MTRNQRSGLAPITAEVLLQFGFAEPALAAHEINELFDAVFGPSDPEVRAGWLLGADDVLRPKRMARSFRRAAEAEDPLQCLDRDSTARALLNACMRARWSSREARAAGHPSSLAGLAWSSLSDAARVTVRDGLLHLSGYQDALVRRGAPRKDRTDTTLEGLAEIYAQQTGIPCHLLLEHAERSQFVQFAVMMLHGHLAPTELEPAAIAQRWKRLKSLREHGLRKAETK